MSRLVIDASVAVKWFLPESHGEAALRLLDPDHELLAPDLIWAEVTNVLWKRRRRGEIAPATARGILADFRRFPLRIAPAGPMIEQAFAIADQLARSVYDCLYLALARRAQGRLVTADRRLYAAAAGSPLAASLLWVEERP